MNKTSRVTQQIPPTSRVGKKLVAYFSWSGNTREIASQIHGMVGGEMFEIVSVDTYPSVYDECVEQAKRELDKGYRPKLKSEPKDLDSFDVVFIGYPNWWGTIPMPVAAFLSKCDSPEKTIAPFCTHGGGRLGQSLTDIRRICSHSTILEALAIREGNVKRANHDISEWLRRIRMVRDTNP